MSDYDDKSHVSMEQKVCPVCQKTFETNAILLDRRLQKSLHRHTITGFDLCPEHAKQKDERYIFLIGIDETKSMHPFRPDTVYCLGQYAAIKASAWDLVFNVPPPPGSLCYCGADVLGKLQEVKTHAS